MRKIIFFIGMLVFMFLPDSLSAQNVFETQCAYSGSDLEVIVKIYSDDSDDSVEAFVTLYKFGDKTWGDGEEYGFLGSYKVEVVNYTKSVKVGSYTVSAYEDYSNYTCPSHILVASVANLGYAGYVSNDYTDLISFYDSMPFGYSKQVGSYVGEANEEADDLELTCLYTYTDTNCASENAHLSVDVCTVRTELEIYSNGRMSATNYDFFNSSLVKVGSENVENDMSYNYSGKCPEYLLTVKDGTGGRYYVSDTKSTLESKMNSNGWSIATNGNDNKAGVIGSLSGETSDHLTSNKTCTYDDIPSCDNCKISIVFKNPDNLTYQYVAGYVGEHVVQSHTVLSGNISNVVYKSDGWNVRVLSAGTMKTIRKPFNTELPNFCPSGLYFDYNSSNRILNIYPSEADYAVEHGNDYLDNIDTGLAGQVSTNLSTCVQLLGSASEDGSVASLLDSIYTFIKIGSIILVIVLSLIEFSGAVVNNKEDIMKVVVKTVKRLVILIVILLLPMLIDLLGSLVGQTDILCGIK